MRSIVRTFLVFCCCLLMKHEVFSAVKLPRLISNGMVLQRNTGVKIWGWASEGEKISIRFNGKLYHTTCANGKWSVVLDALRAGGPYEMNIRGVNEIILKNILIGDVWVCSGQSNMELPMARVKEKYSAVINAAANPNIRQFDVATTYAFGAEQEDLSSGSWREANPATVLQFTATGYFFAKALYEKYKVPIGLIRASVGGSPAEAWLSEDALKAFPIHLQKALKFSNSAYVDSIKKADAAASDLWYTLLWQRDRGLLENPKWHDTNFVAAGWPSMQVPGYWHDQGLEGVNGVVWFRKEISIPARMAGKPARLLLGNVVDRDSVYINGTFAGTTGYQYPPRQYDLPSNLLKPGKNIIVVRVINSAGKGGFYEDKPYRLLTADDTIDISGQWQFKPGAITSPLAPATTFQYQPSGLFNAMIAPLLNFSIKGVIWYQGESNTADPAEYNALFPAVINNWRQEWQQGNFPFLFVQLASFMKAKDQPSESNWAAVREAQLKALALPMTGMAVAIDIGEWNDVHPLNKQDVGYRLALAARHIAYGDKKVVYSGPVYQSMKIRGKEIVLSFAHAGSGLIAKDGKALKHFSIAGADKKFIWANARIEGNKVIVWNNSLTAPVAVRYAWADNPAGANLFNKEGLPASPFRTDQ